MDNINDYLKISIDLARKAGAEIMKIYSKDFKTYEKPDHTPLTQADIAANKIICKGLKKTMIPIITEENEESHNYKQRKENTYFWLIDPLDGTKEFVKKNGEFTINIALIVNKQPVLGVVFAPATNELYYAVKDYGAYKSDNDISIDGININKRLPGKSLPLTLSTDRPPTAVVSHSFADHQTMKWLDVFSKTKGCKLIYKKLGSSLKICKIAEGNAQVYPRFGPSKEWDIAAAHIILNEAGGRIENIIDGSEITYNKEVMDNPNFVALLWMTE